MIIASGPYISDHFAATVKRNGWPVLDAGGAAEFGLPTDPAFSGEDGLRRAAERLRSGRALTTGEHALGLVGERFADAPAARAALRFKDKAEFRRSVAALFPDLWFREIPLEALRDAPPPEAPYPVVLKPAVGFFSIGVRIVHGPDDWVAARDAILAEVASAGEHFPEHVLGRARFLLEAFIEGEEYAVDACYDAAGEPVVFNVLQHRYASGDDVSDRLYVSSRRIVEDVRPAALAFLRALNGDRAIRDFPLHAEFRRGPGGRLTPIEINPLRFGGWCTTGDFAHFAWGFNSYELYMDGAAPDWEKAFAGREDREFGLVVLDNDTGVAPRDVAGFDYEALLAHFSRPLHLARMDYRRFPLFGFLFVETPEADRRETDWILRAKLREFLR